MNDIIKNIICNSTIKLTKCLNGQLGKHHIVHFSELIDKNTASSYLDLYSLYFKQNKKLKNLEEHVKNELNVKDNKDTFLEKYYSFKNSILFDYDLFNILDKLIPEKFFYIDVSTKTKILLNVLDNLIFKNSVIARKVKQNSGWDYFFLDDLRGTKLDEEFEFGWALERILFRINNAYLHHKYIHPLNVKDRCYGAFVFYSNDRNIDLSFTNDIIKDCLTNLVDIETFKELQSILKNIYDKDKNTQIGGVVNTIDKIHRNYLEMSLDIFNKKNNEEIKSIILYMKRLKELPINKWTNPRE